MDVCVSETTPASVDNIYTYAYKHTHAQPNGRTSQGLRCTTR